MIEIKIQEIGNKLGIFTAYRLQILTGFTPGMASRIWKGKWKQADLGTLNTLCNVLKCTPNDILKFTPDEPEE